MKREEQCMPVLLNSSSCRKTLPSSGWNSSSSSSSSSGGLGRSYGGVRMSMGRQSSSGTDVPMRSGGGSSSNVSSVEHKQDFQKSFCLFHDAVQFDSSGSTEC